MTISRFRCERGQSLIEFALVSPLLFVLAFGVIECCWALLDQHIVTKLSREGSNLISRDVTLETASDALQEMATRPVDFDANARMVLSVLKRVNAPGTTNHDKIVLYQRFELGTLSAASKLKIAGSATPGPAPDFVFPNSDHNANLRITPVPANVSITPGNLLYVTEIFTAHPLITPFDRFGALFPDRLYSIAYF